MAWLRIESNFASHRKVLAAGQQLGKGAVARVIGIWTIGACYAVAHLTDGLVPGLVLKDTRYDKKPGEVVDALVAVGLLHAEGDGYRLHDFHEYNPSASEVKANMQWDARRKKLYSTPGLVTEIRERDQNCCRYCGVEVSWTDRRSGTGGTYDHVQPRGENSLGNVVVSCFRCNMRKRDRTPEQAGMTLRPVPDVIGTSSNQVRTSSHTIPTHTIPNPNPIPRSRSRKKEQRAVARPVPTKVLVKLAHEVLDQLSPDADLPPMSELCATLKDLAAVHRIPFATGRDVTKAMDSALAQRRVAAS